MIGKRLCTARKKMNLTLTEVAERMNVSHTTISRYESGKRKTDPDTLITLCKLYNVSANYILGLPKDMPYPENEE